MKTIADLEETYRLIQPDLARTEARILKILETDNPLAQEAIRHFFSTKGKLLRPALCLLASGLGEERSEHLVSVAAGLEILHAATLVHDDIVDGATLRRNLPTLHVRWGPQAAVLLGDYLYDRAFHTFCKTRDPVVIDTMLEVARLVCDGEILELDVRGNLELTETQYLEIIDKKTASFLAACLQVGGHLSGLAAVDTERLRAYGLAFGKAFQIVDDCLDISGEQHVFGKTLGLDCEAGVLTLPWIRLREMARDTEFAFLAASSPGSDPRSPRGGIPAERVRELAGALREAGALDYAYERAREFVRDARVALSAFPSTNAKQSLDALLDFVLERQQ